MRTPAAGPSAALAKAQAALADGRLAEAEALCRHALNLDAGNAQLRSLLGAALRRQRRAAEAEAEYREVARVWPRSPVAHVDLGTVLLEQHRWDEAAAALRVAVALARSGERRVGSGRRGGWSG